MQGIMEIQRENFAKMVESCKEEIEKSIKTMVAKDSTQEEYTKATDAMSYNASLLGYVCMALEIFKVEDEKTAVEWLADQYLKIRTLPYDLNPLSRASAFASGCFLQTLWFLDRERYNELSCA